MNWIKQNKILAGIAAIALLGVAILAWFAFTNMAASAKLVAKYKANAGELSRLYSGQLFPSQANLKAKQESVAALKKETDNLRDSLAKQYGADEKPQDHVTFGQRVQRRYEELRKAWEASGMKVPEDFFLGLEHYREKVAASKTAVRHLDHQLDAITRVVTLATRSGISEILRFERGLVPGEEGAPAAAARADGAATPAPPARYPLEVQCVGTEQAVRAFVNSLAASDRHFFAFTAVRLQNESATGPDREKVREKVKTAADAAAPSGAADLFAGLSGEAAAAPAAAEPGAAPAAGDSASAGTAYAFAEPGVKDAYLFLGGEQVKAVVRFDLVVFEPRPAAATEGAPNNP